MGNSYILCILILMYKGCKINSASIQNLVYLINIYMYNICWDCSYRDSIRVYMNERLYVGWYEWVGAVVADDSDLNQYLEVPGLNGVVPLSEGAFTHAWAGARGTHGVAQGRVLYEVPHLTSPHPTPPHLTSPHLTPPHLTAAHTHIRFVSYITIL